MKIIHGSLAARGRLKKTVLTLGVFDGVHRGHQHIFKRCLQEARRRRRPAVVYTFDPHPVSVLSPAACPPLLSTAPQKLALIAGFQFAATVIERFTKRFSHVKPEAFFTEVLVKRLQAESIYVGYNFTFGIHRSGNTELLKKLGEQCGIAVHIVPAFFIGECLLSSTEVRHRIVQGDVERAAEFLGRPYSIEGTVVRGAGLGKKLGIPTANLRPSNELLPASGVYITRSHLGSRSYPSVTNIGIRPTVGNDKKLHIEAHLLDFHRSLLNRPLRLEFLKRLREERRFRGQQELVKQILHDIQVAKRYFKRRGA